MLKNGLLATGVALSVNLLLYGAGRLLDWIPANFIIPTSQMPFTAGPVVFATVAGCLGGVLLWLGLRRLKRGRDWFLGLSSLVLLISFVTPLGIGAPLAMILLLEMMHLGVALPLMFWLPQK